MILYYHNSFGDVSMVNLPSSTPWEITYQEFDEDDLDNCSLYLKVDGKEYLLRDLEYWRQGRPSLPIWEVSQLYEDLLQAIFQQLRLCPDIAALDLDEIEGDILLWDVRDAPTDPAVALGDVIYGYLLFGGTQSLDGNQYLSFFLLSME